MESRIYPVCHRAWLVLVNNNYIAKKIDTESGSCEERGVNGHGSALWATRRDGHFLTLFVRLQPGHVLMYSISDSREAMTGGFFGPRKNS